MKLTLTQYELIDLVNAALNIKLKFDDLIIDKVNPFSVTYEAAIRATLNIYGNNMVVFPDKKIAAIKHLRELMRNVDAGRKFPTGATELGIGLVQAKTAIERPMETIEHAHRYGEPKSS